METNNITLNLLIKQGREIKGSIKEIEKEWGGYYKLQNNSNYQLWKNQVKRFLAINFQDDFQLEDLNIAIQGFEKNENYRPNRLEAIIGVLEGYSSLPQKIVVNKKAGKGGVNVTVTNTNNNSLEQSQNQSQAVTIFLEAIKYDVSPRQLEEIKQIISEANNDLEKAKPKILGKVLSWGSSVLGGIVTNLITNPEIIGNL